MTEVRVITNNVPRDIVDACELTERERAEFDYHDWAAIDDGRDSASFVRYNGQTYDLGNFERIGPGAPDAFAGWDGVSADSFFSGVLIKIVDDDQVIMAHYYT